MNEGAPRCVSWSACGTAFAAASESQEVRIFKVTETPSAGGHLLCVNFAATARAHLPPERERLTFTPRGARPQLGDPAQKAPPPPVRVTTVRDPISFAAFSSGADSLVALTTGLYDQLVGFGPDAPVRGLPLVLY